jgi:hypothetical protein
VERRGEDIDAGLDRLADVVEQAPADGGADALCDYLINELADGDDDAALLVVRL